MKRFSQIICFALLLISFSCIDDKKEDAEMRERIETIKEVDSTVNEINEEIENDMEELQAALEELDSL